MFAYNRFSSVTTGIGHVLRIIGLVGLILLSRPIIGQAQEPVTHFEHIDLDQGLSDNTVYSVVQDNYGFLWFGTQDGLNKYDGHNFTVFKYDPFNPNSVSNDNAGNLYADKSGTVWIGTWGGGLNRFDPQIGRFTNYRHDPDDPNSLSYDRVQTIFEDRSGTIWVGTSGGGLDKFDRETETFTNYRHDPANPNSLSQNRIWRIAEDSEGMLWIATSDGLNRLDPRTEQFTLYRADPDDPRSLSHSLIRTLYVDRSGNLWVGTESGLNKFNPETNDFDVFLHDPTDPHSLNDNIINAILEDSAGRFWVGTRTGGLNILDRQSGKFSHYVNDPQDPNSLSYNDIRSIHEDRSGVLWFVTRGGGINKLVPTSGKFIHYDHDPNTPNSLNNNDVRAIHEDQAGVLWIGTKGGGLNKYDPQTGQFTTYQPDPDNPNSLNNNDVYAIYKDRTGIFWLGTSGGGLNEFDPQTGQFTHYQHDPTDPNSLSNDDVYAIYEDRTGNLWLGTKGGGLNKLDRDSGQFTRFQHNPDAPNSLSNDDVYAIHEDETGNLWLGTYGGGLNKFNPDVGQFTAYQYAPDNPNSLSNNNIFTIYEDETGTFWIGTANGGLNKFNPATGEFTRFTKKEGLASDVVYGIIEDEVGNLWLSTNQGISKFNPPTNRFTNYDTSDGLKRVIYREGSHHKGKNDTIFFGGINGLTQFKPAEITENAQPPPIVLTGFNLFNEAVDMDYPLHELSQLELSYEDDVLSFEFAALDYTNPTKNQYAYKLEGFDEDWIPAGSRPFAAYTNLDAGNYTLRIKGSNNAGIWNEEGVAVEIVVTPPFWETWWFRTISVVAVLALGFVGYRIRVRAIEAHRRALQVQVKERTAELLETNQHLQEVTTRLQDEFILAKKIQQRLLPPPRPDWSSPDVICYSTPAYEVGGDFYAYHAFNDERRALVVGDVSGKGMPAALLMAISLASLRSIIRQSPEPTELLARMDRTLKPYTSATNQNCALCYAEINGHTLNVTNAGCIAPIIRHTDGQVEWVNASGLPLGVPMNIGPGSHQEANLILAKGDLVILVSDGVVEAQNSIGEMFGFERVTQTVGQGPQTSAAAMLTHLQDEVTAFVGEVEPHDDLTIVVVQV
jgi:ligand-binding sensor domain-containing protein/serine phosphatase RsbU (regulator of sigma subunit)